MNRTRRLRPIRGLACLLASLAALLAPITTGPAAFASPLRPDPPGWLKRPPLSVHLPPIPPAWNKHPPLPLGHVTGPAHTVPPPTILTGGMPGWQVALIAAAAALLAAALAVAIYRIRVARRRVTASTASATTPSATAPR